MMKRTRTLENRQYRRTAKKNKFGESSFFNILSWDYIRLFFMWISCIVFDMMVGCRLELAYSIVLFVRHYSEMVGAPNGNLKFHSTFSIFYLFMTLMSDLICYLFFPVQKLLFIASTYVWLQVAYQTADRTLNSTCVGLCLIFFSFEYFIRYQITDPKWYESRSAVVTASIMPAITDAFLANQMSTTRIAFYRVFAAHTLGFPLVTFCCKLKNIISDWLTERKRKDVQKKNELFDKILTEAVPGIYDGKKRHEINSRQHLALEADALDFELDPTGSDFLDEPKYSFSQGQLPSIFDKFGNLSNCHSTNTNNTNVKTSINVENKKPNKKLSSNLKHVMKNSKKSSFISTNTANDISTNMNNDYVNNNSDSKTEENINYISTTKKKSSRLISLFISIIERFFVNGLLSIIKIIYNTGSNIITHVKNVSNDITTEATAAFMGDNVKSLNGDDDISTSLDGSQNFDDEDSDRESIMTNNIQESSIEKNGTMYKNNNNGWTITSSTTGKKKNKKNRGRTPNVYENNIDGEFEILNNTGNNIKSKKYKNHYQNDELTKDQEIERLKADLRGAKLIESELKEQLNGMQQCEKQAKNEVQQFKSRYDQLDIKYKQLIKQYEQNKSAIITLEKKIGDTQNRRDQLERELSIERSICKNHENKNSDTLVESLRNKIAKLENDIKKIRNEFINKENLSIKLETKLKEIQNQKRIVQKNADDIFEKVSRLELENSQLKKALSEENRVKQDLFLALKRSKAKIDLLQSKLKTVGITEDDSPNTSTNSAIQLTNGNNDLYRISPTNSSNSPPPQQQSLASINYHDDFQQYFNIRSSPSDYLRDSPTSNISQLLSSSSQHHHLQQQHLTTTHSN